MTVVVSCSCVQWTDLEAELLSQDAAVQRFDEHVLLHAQVQSLHRAARAQQRLMGGRLLQLGEASRSAAQKGKCIKQMKSRWSVCIQGASLSTTVFRYQSRLLSTRSREQQYLRKTSTEPGEGRSPEHPSPPPRLPPAPTVLPPPPAAHGGSSSWASPLSSFSVVQQDVNKVLGRPIASGLRERFYSNTCTRRAGARQRSVTQRGARQLFNYRPASGGEEVNETRSTDSCSFISSRRRNF